LVGFRFWGLWGWQLVGEAVVRPADKVAKVKCRCRWCESKRYEKGWWLVVGVVRY
jgi:hypothetical protein